MLFVRYILLVISLLFCRLLLVGQCSYNYSRTLTINSSKVAGTQNLEEFPVLISLTDEKLKSVSNGGHIEHSNGYDVRFMQTDCSCWLDHQIEKYDPVTGQLIVWVKIPLLKYNEDTKIEIFYGNSAISSDLSSDDVWDAHFVSRYHLNQNPSGTTTDYTNHNNNGNLGGGGMNSSDLIEGKIGYALDFDGNDYIDVGNNNLLGSTFTISAWVQSHQPDNNTHGIVGNPSSSNIYRSPSLWINKETKMRLGLGTGSSWNAMNTNTNTVTNNSGTWHHVVYQYDGTEHILMIDGEISDTKSDPGLIPYSSSVKYIGRVNTYFVGKIDEVSLSDVVRSEDWIATEFNNQDNPADFISVGSEKEADCSGPGGVDLADGTGDLVLWLKGDCGLKDANGSFPSEGESVKDWLDQSGTGNHYYQSSSGSRPTYTSTAINNYPGIYMTGPQFFNGPDVTYNESTVFFVINAIDYGDRSRLFNNASYSFRFEQWYNTGTFGYTRYGIEDYNSGVATPYGESIILSFTKAASGSSYTIKKILNGEVVSSGSMNVGSTNAPVPLYELGYLTQGYIPEIIIFNRVLNEDEEGLVQDYLSGKYGIKSPRITGTTGPGGVGDTLGVDALKLWLKADTKVTHDGSGNVSNWENIVDISNLDLSASGGSMPSLVNSSSNFNDYPVVSFNGSNKLITSTTLSTDYFPTNAATVFIVSNADNTSQTSTIYGTDPLDLNRFSAHIPWSGNYYNDIGTCCGSTARINGSFGSAATTYIWGYTASSTNGKSVYRNGTNLKNLAGTESYSNHASNKFQVGSGYSGDIAELIIYNQRLNDAERVIIENYLGEKYNVGLGVDYYTGHTGAYVNEIQGIGTSDGTLDNAHIQSKNSGGLEITMLNNSFNATNEYAFVGYKETTNAIVTDDVPPGVEKRLKRAWYIDVTGSVDLELNFNLESSGIGGFPSGADYVLLYSPTNAFSFSNWTALNGITPSVSTSNVTFQVTNTYLTDGYYTLATTNSSGSPLPIVLIGVDAEVYGKDKVKINWSTASEFNNDYYLIQRSPTGYNWEEIMKIDGAGTSFNVLNYETVDANPYQGTSYYRLKQVDFDGKFSFSPIVSVEMEDNGEIILYPNPANTRIYVANTLGKLDLTEMALYNQMGQKQSVSLIVNQGYATMDVSSLKNGIYFVEVNAKQKIARYRIVISH